MRIVETRNRRVRWRHKRRGHRKRSQVHECPDANTVYRDPLEDVSPASRSVRRQSISRPVTLVGGKYTDRSPRESDGHSVRALRLPDVADSPRHRRFSTKRPDAPSKRLGKHLFRTYSSLGS